MGIELATMLLAVTLYLLFARDGLPNLRTSYSPGQISFN